MSIVIKVEILGGTSITEALYEMKELATLTDCQVISIFNGCHVGMTRSSNVPEKLKMYHMELQERIPRPEVPE